MGIGGMVGRVWAQGRSWLRAMVQRDGLEAGMEAELADHLQRLTEDLVRSGCGPAEAARRARIALGPALVHKEGMRASLGLRWWDELRADLRFALRLMRKELRFTAIAAVSLALAIGANSTIFAVVKQLLFAPLHVVKPGELKLLRWNGDDKVAVHGMWGDFDSAPAGGITSTVFSYPVYQQLRAHNQVLKDLVGFKEDGMNATVRGEAQRVAVSMVTGNFYAQLGVRPQLGRAIVESDEAVPGAGAVAVISDGLWERAFGRSPSVLGQVITLNQAAFTIVGVNPSGFTGVKSAQSSPDLFVPLTMQPVIAAKGETSLLSDRGLWWVNVMARSKAGVSAAQAQAALAVALEAATRATIAVKAGETMPHLALADGSRGLRVPDRTFRKPLYVLWALTGFVLLLACANVANLLLTRGMQRQREMSVRLALGAGRARLLRQLLTESLLLAGLGGVGGLMLGYMGRNVLPALLSESWRPSEFNVHFDWVVFAATSLVTLTTGVVFGMAPAWLAMRTEISGGLKETGQNLTRRRKGLSGRAMVAFQIAVSTILLVGAGMFMRTIWNLSRVDVGFKADNLLLLEVNPPRLRYPAGKDVALHVRLEQQLAAAPGVESVSPGVVPYISDSMSNSTFMPEGEADDAKAGKEEYFNMVGTTFFETMGIPLVAGRAFESEDTASSNKVAVINEALAHKRFPNMNPIGRRFRVDMANKKDWIEVVGVCRNTRYWNLKDAPPPQFFLPYFQQPEVGGMVYQVRTHVGTASLVPELRRVVQGVDPDLPITEVRTQRQQIDSAMQMERAVGAMTAGFGLLAMALAAVGIYGVMAYSVAQRSNEIGIRLALGAQPRQVRGMILRESAWTTGVGVVSGLGAALLLTRAIKSMLYGIEPYDPATVAAAAGLLILLALAASWIPARRAAGVQPMDALRHE